MNIITKVIYLDFQTAFDMIPHQKGLSNLSSLEIKDKFLLWLNKSKYDRKCKGREM